jgi:uncharacterized protein (DUF1501 family)
MSTRNRLSDSGVSRRDMIRIGAGGIGFGLFGGLGPVPYLLGQASRAAAQGNESRRILVVFEWFGGNDGLNTIVPYGDPMYYKHRPTIGIKEKDLLKIDAQFGWHKSLRGMKTLYDEGKLAIVQGVGYDQPSFSHFTSVSYWHTAAPNSGNEFGWIGRTASLLDPGGHENMIVNIADSQTLAVKAQKHIPLVFIDPTRFQRAVYAQEKAALEVLAAQQAPVGDAHKYVLDVTRSAEQASELVRSAWRDYKGKDNRNLRLLDLDKVAALIEADFPTRLYYVPLRNSLFDTHVNQAAPHDRQLQYCSDAIAGFFQEMQRLGRADDVVMYVYSEFGRRVPENTSLGTDHGTAQVNFVVGNAVKGGLYGAPPSLTNLVLGDNLERTTDFRRVYATLIQDWLGVDSAKVLGQKFESLGMFRA